MAWCALMLVGMCLILFVPPDRGGWPDPFDQADLTDGKEFPSNPERRT